MKNSASLSHLQNEFIMAQERTIQQLKLHNQQQSEILGELRLKYDTLQSQYCALQADYRELSEQLEFQRRECRTRHLNYSKYKDKYRRAKLELQHNREVITALETHLKKATFRFDALQQTVEEMQNISDKMEPSHNKCTNEESRRELTKEREAHMKSKIEAEKFRKLAEELEEKLSYSNKHRESIREANEQAFAELQDNLEKILEKVMKLEIENQQLRECHRVKCEENENYRSLLDQVSSPKSSNKDGSYEQLRKRRPPLKRAFVTENGRLHE